MFYCTPFFNPLWRNRKIASYKRGLRNGTAGKWLEAIREFFCIPAQARKTSKISIDEQALPMLVVRLAKAIIVQNFMNLVGFKMRFRFFFAGNL
jgi:hypothetical protein